MKDIQHDILDKITPDIKEQMEHIWFTADLHSDHPKIVNICGRPVPLIEGLDMGTPEDKRRINELHNDWLIREVYNKYIDKRDEVYLLGDISMAPKNVAEKFIDRLHGNKHLILGNHCKNIAHSTRFSEITQRKNFTFNRGGLNMHIVLDHYPLASWERKIHGSWHLYGHVHGRFNKLHEECMNLLGMSMDVGLDNKESGHWCKPVNLYEIVLFIEKKHKSLRYSGISEFNAE